MELEQWALARLERLLPLDEESLKQVLAYTLSLPKQEASNHLENILGDSPQAYEFIAALNQRRPAPTTTGVTSSGPPVIASSDNNELTSSSTSARVSARGAQRRNKKPGFNKLPPLRQVDDQAEGQRAYRKPDEEDYMNGSKGRRPHDGPLSSTLALNMQPDAIMEPKRAMPLLTDPPEKPDVPSTASASQSQPKLPRSAAGSLISDSLVSQSRGSRNSSPANKQAFTTKVSLTGGASMRGATTTLADLDSAIRTLEAQTNPTLVGGPITNKGRACSCQAQRHALLAAAPNCLNCGKIVCAKEGLGPCTFCHTPLLSHAEIGEMLRTLKEERGHERTKEHNSQHRKADVAKSPRPFTSGTSTPRTLSGPGTPRSISPAPASKLGVAGDEDATLANAKAHRDRLLAFQAQNARRTRILDEAADYETPDSGTSMWASPQERALQLKRQQKVLREQEWNARPEYEKRRMVVSLDIKGGKAVRRMQEIGKDEGMGDGDADDTELQGNNLVDQRVLEQPAGNQGGVTGFSKNPLLGSLIRPVWRVANSVDENEGKANREKRNTWRRVQDDDDNERWILDGGAYGYGEPKDVTLGAEEHAHG